MGDKMEYPWVTSEGFEGESADERGRVFTLLASRQLATLLRGEQVQQAIGLFAELRGRFEKEGVALNFGVSKELGEALRSVYGRCWVNGDLVNARSLKEAFGPYFELPSPKR